jgi:hypothetical protein
MIEKVAEVVAGVNPIGFVTWLNAQLRQDFSRWFKTDGHCKIGMLEIDDSDRHLRQYLLDDVVRVSGWLKPAEGQKVHTPWLLQMWLVAPSLEKEHVIITFECREPALLSYCHELVDRAQQLLPGSEPARNYTTPPLTEMGQGPGQVKESGDYQSDEIIKLIEKGAFDGCEIDRETAIQLVKAIEWLSDNPPQKFTVIAITEKAQCTRQHYYNFRKGCEKAGVQKIRNIDVISVRSNNY